MYGFYDLFTYCRSLHCFEAMLKQVSDAGIDGLALDNIKEYLVAAYEETVKPYHRWITQQAFYVCIIFQ